MQQQQMQPLQRPRAQQAMRQLQPIPPQRRIQPPRLLRLQRLWLRQSQPAVSEKAQSILAS